jgi:hypothetical protein
VELGDELQGDLKGHFKQEDLVRWAKADESGQYHIRLGPGHYQLRGPDPLSPEELVVAVEEEIVRDFHLPHLSRGLLTGTVRRSGQAGRAVANAVVRGESQVRGHAGFETFADREGRFSSERWRDRMLVYARDPEGAEAGCTEIGELDEGIMVQVSPAGTARGRVVGPKGCLRSNESVLCRMNLSLGDGTRLTFQIEVRTDLMGEYLIQGLVVGSSCDVTVLRCHWPITQWVPFTIAGPGTVEVLDLVLEETVQ